MPHRELITGVVLAGGRARRMAGEDKGLIPLNGRAMVAYVLQVLEPQVGRVLINANRSLERYAAFGYPVVSDATGDFSGPLAGMASAMRVATTPFILTVPCDSPLLPADLAQRLHTALIAAAARVAVAHDGERMQPVFALIDRRLLPDLEDYLASGERKIDRWLERQRLATADFSDERAAFINVNTPEERAALAAQLSGGTAGGG